MKTLLDKVNRAEASTNGAKFQFDSRGGPHPQPLSEGEGSFISNIFYCCHTDKGGISLINRKTVGKRCLLRRHDSRGGHHPLG
jgi:hypothetical protein